MDLIDLHFTSDYTLYIYYVTNKETLTLLLLVPCASVCVPPPVLLTNHCFSSSPVSPSLPSFVSLFSLLVSCADLLSYVVYVCVCIHSSLSVCFSPFRVVFVHLCFYFQKNVFFNNKIKQRWTKTTPNMGGGRYRQRAHGTNNKQQAMCSTQRHLGASLGTPAGPWHMQTRDAQNV